MSFAKLMNGGGGVHGPSNDELAKLMGAANGINRHYNAYQQYGSQNPYESYAEPNPNQYAYLPVYEASKYGAPTFHHHAYSSLGGEGGGSDTHRHSHSSNKSTQLSMSALTLLAFLFFIQMLQSCLKEQMQSMNPTVMVMSSGASRLTKKMGTSSLQFDENKEVILNAEDSDEIVLSVPIPDKVEFLTNDQGDVFYQSKKTASNKQSTHMWNGRSQEATDETESATKSNE